MSDQNQLPPDGPQAAPPAQPRQQFQQQPLPSVPSSPSVPKEYLDEMLKNRQEAEQLRAELKRRDAADAETKVSVAKLTEQVALTENQKNELANARKSDAIRSAVKMAALEHNAVDPDDVVALTSAQFNVGDDGRVMSKDATPLEASAFIKSFLEKKPHLARPRVAPGAGSTPFSGPAPQVQPPPQFDMKTREGATSALHHALSRFMPKATG